MNTIQLATSILGLATACAPILHAFVRFALLKRTIKGPTKLSNKEISANKEIRKEKEIKIGKFLVKTKVCITKTCERSKKQIITIAIKSCEY